MQAWAFASGARLVLGKVPLMNMENYPHDVWNLHRKLFHRFLKYRKYFIKATSSLPEYKNFQMKKDPEPVPREATTATPVSDQHIIYILSSSEGEVSEDSDSETEDVDVDELFESDGGEGEDDKQESDDGEGEDELS